MQAIRLVDAAYSRSHSPWDPIPGCLAYRCGNGSRFGPVSLPHLSKRALLRICFDFGWNTGTGMEPTFLCSVQPVLEQNHRELMKALLSQVQFVTPGIRRAAREKPHRSSPPTVLSLERSTADTAFRSTTVTVSWSTRGTDYVQLQYPCVEKLSVSELGGADSPWPPGVDMKCGAVVGQNFPPNGSAKLMLSNFNPSSVNFVLSIEPFSDGVGCPKQSKTITVSVGPHP